MSSGAIRRAWFWVDASNGIGFGHLERCIAIAEASPTNWEPHFLCEPAHQFEIRRRLEKTPYSLSVRDNRYGGDSRGGGSQGLVSGEVCFIDRSHREVLEDPDPLKRQLDAWQQVGTSTALIDGSGDQTLITESSWPVDYWIQPYVGAESSDHFGYRALLGSKFAVFKTSFGRAAKQPRPIKHPVERLLITFGGSDPTGCSRLVLDALATHSTQQLPYGLKRVDVIVGPGYSDSLKHYLKGLEMDGVVIRENVTDLVDPMRACDIAIANTGLTKYELAATGTPALLISIDETHSRLHRPFGDRHTARHLGVQKELNHVLIQDALTHTMADHDQRKRMSNAGKALLDGNGASRIWQAISRPRDLN